MLKLVIATKNSGKVSELTNLLEDLPFELLNLNDFPNIVEAEENGATFVENAEIKARSYAGQTGVFALADDSGLEVAALGGAPGIYSARYAGENADDAAKIEKLLDEIRRTGDENRSARFVCAIAIAEAGGEIIFTAEGFCEGKIAFAPRGRNGFGYDPVFIPSGFDETLGELSGSVKRNISHRARALTKINRYLRDFIAV